VSDVSGDGPPAGADPPAATPVSWRGRLTVLLIGGGALLLLVLMCATVALIAYLKR
jgi:hypothetical protein